MVISVSPTVFSHAIQDRGPMKQLGHGALLCVRYSDRGANKTTGTAPAVFELTIESDRYF